MNHAQQHQKHFMVTLNIEQQFSLKLYIALYATDAKFKRNKKRGTKREFS